MFPKPIEKSTPGVRTAYQVALPIVLIIWLLPLIAVAVFSIKPDADFTNGNYWGWPTEWNLIANYKLVFTGSSMPRYLMNSVLITVPTVIGVLILSCMTGFALGIYRFRFNMMIFFMFI